MTLNEFINDYYKRIYGKVTLNTVNVTEISKITFQAPIYDIDANIVLTDGNVSTHKTNLAIVKNNEEDEDGIPFLYSSAKISKATWVVLGACRLDEDQELYIELNLSIIGDGDYDSIKDQEITTMMRM